MAHYKGAASEGGRAMQLQKKRQLALEELEHKKKKIEEDLKLSKLDSKFSIHYDAIEQQLKTSTIGLVTLNEMKEKQETAVKQREKQLAKKEQLKEMQRLIEIEMKEAERDRQKRQIATLSFNMDDDLDEENEDGDTSPVSLKAESSAVKEETLSTKSDDEEEEEGSFSKPRPILFKKICKNPDVDTSFLPDREREEEENRLREELRQEWVQRQEKLKNEEIDITFSYWDGSGHRRNVVMKKGNTIHQFLQRCLEILRKEFNELKALTADQLIYIKEDLIIPQHYTFYDFIVTKARGKSGPLFSFDVHDDVRMISDAGVEKDESHAGKVLMRSWYERNKHIFPASRWEPYDPEKNYDKYTISDKHKK